MLLAATPCTDRGDEAEREMVRWPQHERSVDTIAKLLDATIDLFHDCDLARMSTGDIAARGGVSRGAVIAVAVARRLGSCTTGLRSMAEDIRCVSGSAGDIVDYLWRMMSNRLFHVAMEYLPKAQHDAEFRRRMLPVVRDFHDGLNAVWAELFGQAGAKVGRARAPMNATICMIAQGPVKDDPGYCTTVLGFWKGQLRKEFSPVSPPHNPLAVTVS